MPRLEIKPYCEGCPEFVAETNMLYANNVAGDIVITCEHRGLCAKLVEHLKGKTHYSPMNDPLFKL